MSAEAAAESMAMPNVNADYMDAGSVGGTDVQTEAMAMVTPPSVETPKTNLPVLDLLHWSEAPSHNPNLARVSATNDSSAFMNATDERPFLQSPVRSEVRTSQPAGGISTISFGSNLTLEESEQLKRRPASDLKRREMKGSRIFEQETTSECTPDHLPKKTLAPAGMATSQRAIIHANNEGLELSPKKLGSLSEVAKQRELSGTFFGATDTPGGRPCSSAKSRELEGSNIFGRSTQDELKTLSPKSLVASDFNKSAGAYYQENYVPPRTSVRVSHPAGGRSQISFGDDGVEQQFRMQSKKQDHNQKAAEFSGHNIIKGEPKIASNTNNNGTNPCERIVSAAKRREMLGNDIFSDATPVVTQDHPRRARQPPGGQSNLKLF